MLLITNRHKNVRITVNRYGKGKSKIERCKLNVLTMLGLMGR